MCIHDSYTLAVKCHMCLADEMNPFADDQQNMLAQILDEDVDKFVAKCAKRVNEEPTDEKSIDEIAAVSLLYRLTAFYVSFTVNSKV